VLATLPQYEYNVLILYTEAEEVDLGTPKKPSALLTKLSEAVTPVLFRRETPARLASWIAKHFAAEQIVAPPSTVDLLLNRCGCDMYLLSSEIEKLAWYLKSQGREHLTEADVKTVTSEVKEIAAFDLADAILDGKAENALSILNEMKRRKERPEIILGGIARVIGDLVVIKTLTDSGMTFAAVAAKLKKSEYQVSLYAKNASRRDAVRLHAMLERCYEADLRIKSTQIDSYTVLDRLAAEAASR
jgi:DNA polymerase-3 subunit delta